MSANNLRSDRTALWISWVLISAIGWAASRSVLQVSTIQSINDVIPRVVTDAFDGVLIGTILTLGQWFILRRIFPKLSRWFLILILLYPVGLIAGLMVDSAWGLEALRRGGTFVILLPPRALFIAGVIIGMGQSMMLRPFLTPNLQSVALWVLGIVAGLGFGAFVGGVPLGLLNLTMLPQSVKGIVDGVFTGLISGVITGSILLILLKQQQGNQPLGHVGVNQIGGAV